MSSETECEFHAAGNPTLEAVERLSEAIKQERSQAFLARYRTVNTICKVDSSSYISKRADGAQR